MDLGLLQREVADRIAVRSDTFLKWEKEQTVPPVRYMRAIIAFLGYDPDGPPRSLPERLVALRRRPGLTRTRPAVRLGVVEATVMGWERSRWQPRQEAAQVLERLFEEVGI